MLKNDGALTARIVRMVDADVERIAPVLARAFDEDPLFVWVEPEPKRRRAFVFASLETLRETNVRYYGRFGFEVAVEGRLAGSGPASG